MSISIIHEKANNYKCLEYIGDYLKAGFNVIPLKSRDKIPAVKKWKPLLNEPLTEESLLELYQSNPELNIGLITGPSSRGLVVIDIDHSPPEELAFLIAQNPTVTVKTSRGRHYYYLRETKLSNLNFDWGELRADGVYVVAPPSIHPDGTEYQFLEGLGLDKISKLPESIFDFLTSQPKHKKETLKYLPPKNELKYTFIGGKINTQDNEAKPYSFLGGNFKRSYQDQIVAFKILGLFGVEVSKLGQAFKCPIHPEDNPSAALWRGKNGNIMLHEFHQGDNYWTLPETYASCIYRRTEFIKLSSSQMVRWWIRALADINYIELPVISFKPLPLKSPKTARKVYEGIILLVQVQKFYDSNQGDEVLFSHGFGLEWCGYADKNSIKDGLKWLLKNGYIEKTKEAVLCGKREAALYRLKRG